MKKVFLTLLACVMLQAIMAQDAMTGASTMAQPQPQQTDSVETAKHVTGIDLSFTLLIVNKTSSNYRVMLDGHYLGKIAPKKKGEFKAQTDWAGKLVAEQLDGYDLIPSKIIWQIPKQTPGTTVTFTINKK